MEGKMAIEAAGYELVVEFADNGNEKVTRTYGVVADTTYADLLTAVPASIIPAIIAVTDDAVIGWFIKTLYADPAYSIPASGVQNENQAIITVRLDGLPTESGTLTIPAAKPTVFVATSGRNANVVNTAASIVTNFIGLFVSGGLLTLSDGELALATGAFGKRRHTKNTNG